MTPTGVTRRQPRRTPLAGTPGQEMMIRARCVVMKRSLTKRVGFLNRSGVEGSHSSARRAHYSASLESSCLCRLRLCAPSSRLQERRSHGRSPFFSLSLLSRLRGQHSSPSWCSSRDATRPQVPNNFAKNGSSTRLAGTCPPRASWSWSPSSSSRGQRGRYRP